MSVNDLPVARLGDSTLHCGGRGVLIQGSSNVNVGGGSVGLNVTLGQLVGGMLNTTLGNSSMSVEEMARKNALLMLDNAQISLMRWNESDQAQFKEWFGTTDETARRAMLDRIDRSRPILQEAPLIESRHLNHFAEVYPNDKSHNIYLGKAFYSAPSTGINSQAGTLLHEVSHFDDVAGTDDHVYGTSDARDLAKTNSNDAAENADNFEYWMESQ